MTTTTETGLHYGTIEEFIKDRIHREPNLEQLEAFAKEFYLSILQIVSCRKNAFSLQNQLSFPELDVEAIDFFTFTIWTFRYLIWVDALFSFETRVLVSAQITWS